MLTGLAALALLVPAPPAAGAARYEIRAAAVAVGADGVVSIYFRLNRELPFRPDDDDASSTPWVRAGVTVAGTRPFVALSVRRMGPRRRHCYRDEHEFRSLPRVLRRARRRPGSTLPIALRIEGVERAVRSRAVVLPPSRRGRERALRCSG